MSSLNITNPNNYSFDEKYSSAHEVDNEKDNSRQELNNEIINRDNLNQNQEEVNSIQMDINQKNQEVNNIQMVVNQKQKKEYNNSNKNKSDLYNVNLNSNELQNNNLATALNQLLDIEIRKLLPSGQPSKPSVGHKSKDNSLVPRSKNNSLVPQSKGNNPNYKSNKNNNLLNKNRRSVPTSLEKKLSSLIESLNMTNQINQKVIAMFLISNYNTNNNIHKILERQDNNIREILERQDKMLDQQGKQIENQSNIIRILMKDKEEKKNSSDGN